MIYTISPSVAYQFIGDRAYVREMTRTRTFLLSPDATRILAAVVAGQQDGDARTGAFQGADDTVIVEDLCAARVLMRRGGTPPKRMPSVPDEFEIEWPMPSEASIDDVAVRYCQDHGRLFSLTVELTHRCNEKCPHCFVGCPLPGGITDELSTREWLDALAQARDLGVVNLSVSGGEIFTRRDALDILRGARALALSVTVFTNGTLITPALAHELSDLFLETVRISLYSDRPDQHDRFTGIRGSHVRTVAAIQALVSRGNRVVINCVITRDNYPRIARIRRFAESLGCAVLFDPKIIPRIDGDDTPLSLQVDEEEFYAILSHNEDKRTQSPANLRPRTYPCSAGRTSAFIAPDGEVRPCRAILTAAGNVRTQRLAAMLAESVITRQVREIRFEDLVQCRTCDLHPYCFRCHGRALQDDGDLLGPSAAACHDATLRARYWANRAASGADAAQESLIPKEPT